MTHQALILDCGCKAQLVNPFKENIADYRRDNSRYFGMIVNPKWKSFNEANPPLTITKEYKHLAGKVVNAVEVWQYQIGIDWHNVPENSYSEYKKFEVYQNDVINMKTKVFTRKAFEVIEEESELPYVKHISGHSVEEAAEKNNDFVNSPEWKAGCAFLDKCMVKDEDERFGRFYDFIAGWNDCQTHIINSGEYVKLDNVERMLLTMKLPITLSPADTRQNELIEYFRTTLKNNK